MLAHNVSSQNGSSNYYSVKSIIHLYTMYSTHTYMYIISNWYSKYSKTLQLFTSLHSCYYLSKGMLLAQVPERCITMQQ